MCKLLSVDKPQALDCTALFGSLEWPMGANCHDRPKGITLSIQQPALVSVAAHKPVFAASCNK